MRRLGRIALIGLLASVVGCTGASTTGSSAPIRTAPTTSAATPSPSGSAEPRTGTIVGLPVGTGLDHPATFVVAPDGTIFYGERLTGEIRRLDPKTGKTSHVFTVPGVIGQPTNEQGLVGLTVPPDFPQTPWLYAYASRVVNGRARDQIVRIKTTGRPSKTMQLVLDVKEASERHNGGRMLFGPDGMLYIVVGESYDSTRAQDIHDNGGKVLRMTPDGGVPSDNPFHGSYVFSYGHRNSFGLAFDPETGDLWETENGPECNDEINRIIEGRNYGWGPSESCTGTSPRDTNLDGPHPVPPLTYYEVTQGLTGIAFCDGCGLGTVREGDAFFGSFNTGDIHEIKLNAARTKIVRDTTPYNHGTFVLSIERGPDGTLYFSDGSGIYRLALEG
jgi:glucose/arabinose dehydrogenase